MYEVVLRFPRMGVTPQTWQRVPASDYEERTIHVSQLVLGRVFWDQDPDFPAIGNPKDTDRIVDVHFYQRLGYFMTILPSKNLPHRTMSFGYALMAANVYALRGIMRNEAPATDEDEWLRIKTFFDVASRQLQEGMDPPEWHSLIPIESLA